MYHFQYYICIIWLYIYMYIQSICKVFLYNTYMFKDKYLLTIFSYVVYLCMYIYFSLFSQDNSIQFSSIFAWIFANLNFPVLYACTKYIGTYRFIPLYSVSIQTTKYAYMVYIYILLHWKYSATIVRFAKGKIS